MMMTAKPELQDHTAASGVTGLFLNGKRGRDEHVPSEGRVRKRVMHDAGGLAHSGEAIRAKPGAVPADYMTSKKENMLKPYPYFYYRDFSTVPDSDPLTPLTAPGRVPNFPAKMHSILSRPDLADIVSWMPHGRAWRVLKPREFEIRVIPTYFEHAKFSSFIRQANGWGFRRITQGRDRNCYYHELFLRGVPHLCKMMKRPGVAEKQAADPDHEPDFYKICESFPLPEKAPDDSILLQCTLKGGPKARMPIYLGPLSSESHSTYAGTSTTPSPSLVPKPVAATQMTAAGMFSLPQNAMAQFQGFNATGQPAHAGTTYGRHQQSVPVHAQFANGSSAAVNTLPQPQSVTFPQPVLHHQTHINMNHIPQSPTIQPYASAAAPDKNQAAPSNPLTVLQNSNVSAASQFAAGFAAATALNNQQFCNIFGQALASMPAVGGQQQPQQQQLQPYADTMNRTSQTGM